MYESSSAFALFWNAIRNQLPAEINTDFEEWLKDNDLLRMDTLGSQDVTKGVYTVKCGDDVFEFHGVDMPPPSGMFGVNYTRYVVCARVSQQANRVSGLYTRKEAATNMLSHGLLHGIPTSAMMQVVTSLFASMVSKSRLLLIPSSSGSPNHGMGRVSRRSIPGTQNLAIVTPPGVTRLWKQAQEEKISLEEARRKAGELENEDSAV
jgi:hypothetical protein